MAILLTVLKWIGIILLIILALVLLVVLLLLFVPFRYKGRAGIHDPQCHEEFPVSVLKEQSDVLFDVTWLLGIVKMVVVYPGERLVSLKVFGKDVWHMDKGKKKKAEEEEPEETEEEEEEKEKTLSEKVDAISEKAGKVIDTADYVYRVLTGSCGRRAWSKVKKRLANMGRHAAPDVFRVSGNIGLNDPCLNGDITIFNSVLMPFVDEHLELETEWDLYRCNLEAVLAGKIRVIVPVVETVPLVFDRDCRKVLKKLKKAKAKLK